MTVNLLVRNRVCVLTVNWLQLGPPAGGGDKWDLVKRVSS